MEELRRLFKGWAGAECEECTTLAAGGSNRHYYRLRGGGRTCIGAVNPDVRENRAFCAYSRFFHAHGIPVPELYTVSADNTRYLQQDLGDRTLYGLLYEKKRHGGGFDAEVVTLYRQALADLARIQVVGSETDFGVAYPRQDFDRRSMMWDLNYFKYNFLKPLHIPFDEERLEDDFERFCSFLLEADCGYFLYRDFQTRNIMLSGEPAAKLYYIDYQGARRGAAQYDVASLLYSAKSDLPEALRQELLRHYLDARGLTGAERERWMQHFWGYVLLRIMQAMGAYGFRGLFERKPYFMESIPLAIANLRAVAAAHALPVALPELEGVWQRLGGRAVSPAGANAGLTVEVMSFSYKRGLPEDSSGNGGGFIFDCRALPNPGRYAEYQTLTGRDPAVHAFLQREPAVAQFLTHAQSLVGQSVKKYMERGFTHLCVAFGCTGGQHRSVYCAEQLARWLSDNYACRVTLHHREQE